MNVDGKHLIFFFTILFYFQIIYNIYANLRQAGNLLQDDMLDIAYFRRQYEDPKSKHFGQAGNEIKLLR